MAKTMIFDYALRRNGQTLAVDLSGASTVKSGKVKFKGNRVAISGPTEYLTATNSGASSASIPSPPIGYNFYRHVAVCLVEIRNDTASTIYPSVVLSTPWGTFNGSSPVAPGNTVGIWATSTYTYSPYVGSSVSNTVNAAGGTIVSRTVAADTTGARTSVIGYLQTQNPAVSIGGNSAQYSGELLHEVETGWLPLAGLQPGINNLAVSVAGSESVYIRLEATVEPSLPAPVQHEPIQGARTSERHPWFEFTLPPNPENSASFYHARVRTSTLSTMGDSIFVIESTHSDEWEYLDGSTWKAFPAGGVAPGTRVRARANEALPYQTCYWDCASHDGYDYGANSTPSSLRVMVTVVDRFSVIHNNTELSKITGISILETINGELGELSITLDNQNGAARNLINYGDAIILAVNDIMGNTEEYLGVVKRLTPLNGGLMNIVAATGDRILGERLVTQDYSNQDIGLTVKSLIETYCQPLTTAHVNTNTGIIAPVQAKGRTVLSVMESIRKDYGICYYTDKDWDFHFYLPDDITSAVVQIKYGGGV